VGGAERATGDAIRSSRVAIELVEMAYRGTLACVSIRVLDKLEPYSTRMDVAMSIVDMNKI
jgi:hypothetical protein